jgi:hypothetical protein
MASTSRAVGAFVPFFPPREFVPLAMNDGFALHLLARQSALRDRSRADRASQDLRHYARRSVATTLMVWPSSKRVLDGKTTRMG